MTEPQQVFNELDAAVRRRDHSDPFSWISDATDRHRSGHRCWAYPYKDGTTLGAIAATIKPTRVLELGTALGYTACWWARQGATVDTIENDPVHVHLASENIAQSGLSGLITVHSGNFDQILPTLPDKCSLAFFDGYEPPEGLVADLTSHLDSDGIIVITNLDLGGSKFRRSLNALAGWDVHYIDDVAVAIRP